MDKGEIERLIEAQASGANVTQAAVPVESTIPDVAELDIRRSKSGLAGGSLLCDPLVSNSTEPLPGELDRSPLDPGTVTEFADNLEPEVLGSAVVAADDLGLIKRHDA
jgi:hypothetical protein